MNIFSTIKQLLFIIGLTIGGILIYEIFIKDNTVDDSREKILKKQNDSLLTENRKIKDSIEIQEYNLAILKLSYDSLEDEKVKIIKEKENEKDFINRLKLMNDSLLAKQIDLTYIERHNIPDETIHMSKTIPLKLYNNPRFIIDRKIGEDYVLMNNQLYIQELYGQQCDKQIFNLHKQIRNYDDQIFKYKKILSNDSIIISNKDAIIGFKDSRIKSLQNKNDLLLSCTVGSLTGIGSNILLNTNKKETVLITLSSAGITYGYLKLKKIF